MHCIHCSLWNFRVLPHKPDSVFAMLAAFPVRLLKCLKLSGRAGPSTVDPAKVNRKTVDAHKALQAALLPLGKARQQGSSPAQLRDMAAAKGLLVQDVLRVCTSACVLPRLNLAYPGFSLNWLLLGSAMPLLPYPCQYIFGTLPCQGIWCWQTTRFL